MEIKELDIEMTIRDCMKHRTITHYIYRGSGAKLNFSLRSHSQFLQDFLNFAFFKSYG